MALNLADIYETAYRIRLFEEAVAAAADAGHVPGLAHLCTGAETLEAAICYLLDSDRDFVTGSHRSHGLALAMGADPKKVAAEILGKASGLSNGLGGTQHLIAPDDGFLTSNGIVGAQVPLAAGAALTTKTLSTGGMGVAFFGDGAANQGSVLETMNLSVALELPLLFVLENNGMGQSTSSEYASGGVSLADRADAFGLPSFQLAADDVSGLSEIIPAAIEYVRNEHKPAFLEAFVPRISGHYHGEKHQYTSSNHQEDPLKALEECLETTPKTAPWKHEVETVFDSALNDQQPSPTVLEQWQIELGDRHG